MGRQVRVSISGEERDFLIRVGGSTTGGLRKLIAKGMAGKIAKNSVDLFVTDNIIITNEPKDRECLKRVYEAYIQYCRMERLTCKTKVEMRRYIEDAYNVRYGKTTGNVNTFYGVQLF